MEQVGSEKEGKNVSSLSISSKLLAFSLPKKAMPKN